MQLYFGGKCACSVTQSCPILCKPMKNPPGSSVHGILQIRILEWVAISSLLIFLTQGSDPSLLCLLHWQAHSLPWCHLERSTYWGGAVLNFYCNDLSNPIPPGCQKFNHSQYYISFLQSLPSFRGIVRRSQRWDSSNNCLHSHPLRCSSFSPRGRQSWCSLAGAKSFLSRLSVLKIW